MLCHEEDNPTLAALREITGQLRIHLLIGSLALKTFDGDLGLVTRSFLIDRDGKILARYDKINGQLGRGNLG